MAKKKSKFCGWVIRESGTHRVRIEVGREAPSLQGLFWNNCYIARKFEFVSNLNLDKEVVRKSFECDLYDALCVGQTLGRDRNIKEVRQGLNYLTRKWRKKAKDFRKDWGRGALALKTLLNAYDLVIRDLEKMARGR